MGGERAYKRRLRRIECAPKPPFHCKHETAFTAPNGVLAVPCRSRGPCLGWFPLSQTAFDFIWSVSVGFAAPLVNCLTSELINGLKPYIVDGAATSASARLRESSRTSKLDPSKIAFVSSAAVANQQDRFKSSEGRCREATPYLDQSKYL